MNVHLPLMKCGVIFRKKLIKTCFITLIVGSPRKKTKMTISCVKGTTNCYAIMNMPKKYLPSLKNPI